MSHGLLWLRNCNYIWIVGGRYGDLFGKVGCPGVGNGCEIEREESTTSLVGDTAEHPKIFSAEIFLTQTV